MTTGTIVIKGPMTPEEKASWERLWDQVDQCDAEIAALSAQARRARSEEHRQQIDVDQKQLEKLRAMIVAKIGERPKR